METQKSMFKDEDDEEVDVHMYRLMIGSLMYLTSSRPDSCQPKLGLWYPKDSSFDLVAYTDSDYAGASLDRKSTTGGCQFLRCRLISWQCKKTDMVANPNKAKTINGEVQLHALVDGKKIVIAESSVRRDLQLADEEGVDCLPNLPHFEQLTLMSPKTTAWNEFSSTMASAIICLATNQKFNFESMIRNLDNLSGKFLMYPRTCEAYEQEISNQLMKKTALNLQAELDEEERLVREKAKKEEEANIALIETWDDIQAKIDVDPSNGERNAAQEKKISVLKRAEAEKKQTPIEIAQQRKIMYTYLKNIQISSGLDLTYAPLTITTQQPTEAPQVLQTSTATTTIADTAPTPTNSSSQATSIPSTLQDVDELETQQQHVQHELVTIADNGLEVGSIQRIQGIGYGVLEFLRVGTTHGYAVSSLMDTAYWLSE
ncbi:hypothetical protein Tco_1165897 [Tanacetum coccineum]